MKKDSKYSFLVNKEEKEKFKNYCRIIKVSPSDILMEVIVNFNKSVESIQGMSDISELEQLIQSQYENVQSEIKRIVEHPTFKS